MKLAICLFSTGPSESLVTTETAPTVLAFARKGAVPPAFAPLASLLTLGALTVGNFGGLNAQTSAGTAASLGTVEVDNTVKLIGSTIQPSTTPGAPYTLLSGPA